MAADSRLGQTLAHYRIDGVIGRGGVGVVYRAHDLNLDRDVALKVLSDELASGAPYRARFLREARILGSIDEPHVIPVFDSGEADGVLYIAMRLVSGTDLASRIRSDGRLQPTEAVDLIQQVAEALDAAHERGLIHRDVKPANVLLAKKSGRTRGTHAYLSDFGLTKEVTDTTNLTVFGQIAGTPGYVSPEQIEGNPVDKRADVYALGCLLYTVLTGRIVYERDSLVATLTAQLSDPPPKPSIDVPGLAPGFDAVVAKAMARWPKDRYPTAGDMADAAAEALAAGAGSRAAEAATAAAAGAAAATLAATGQAAAGGPSTVLDLPGNAGVPPTVVDAGWGPDATVGPAADGTIGAISPLTPPDLGVGATVIGDVGSLPGTMPPGSQPAPVPPTALDAIGGGAMEARATFTDPGWTRPASTDTLVEDGPPPTVPGRRKVPVLAAGIAVLLLAGTVAAGAVVTGAFGPSASPSSGISGGTDRSQTATGPTPGPTPSPTISVPPESQPIVSPSPSPDKPKSPKPPDPKPPVDNDPPVGGAIAIKNATLTTNRVLTVRVTGAPSDASKITKMALGFTSTKKSVSGPYGSLNITLPKGTKAGLKNVYAWFMDSGGRWSRTPVRATVRFDNRPVAHDLHIYLTTSAWCDYIATYHGVRIHFVNYKYPQGYLATDPDGLSTVRLIRVRTSTGLPRDVLDGRDVFDSLDKWTNFPMTTLSLFFTVADRPYGLRDTGKVTYTVGPCP